MASKTIEQYRSDRSYKVDLVLSSTANVAGNYSDVRYVLTYRALISSCQYGFSYGNRTKLVINGQTLVDTSNIGSIHFSGVGNKQLASGTIRVYHDADGSKSISCSVIFQQTQNTGLANYNISGTMDLDTIPRTSMSTVSPATVAAGGSIMIKTNRASTAFTHAITYALGAASGTVATGVTDSYTWTVPKDLARQFPNAASGGLILTCTTYSGGTKIGDCLMGVTVTASSDMIPTCSVTVAEAASIPSGITGYVRGKSRLRITVSASGSYGSTIKGYSIKANGASYNSSTATTDYLTTAGTNSVVVTVTDSRGRTASKTVNVTVTDYTAPSCRTVTAYRCNSATDGTAYDKGAYICVSFAGAITALGNKNAKACTVYYKTLTATSWTSKAITLSDYAFAASTIIAADTGSGYNIRVNVRDSFGGSDYYTDVGTAYNLFSFRLNNRGITWGGVAERDGFDIKMPLYINGQTLDGNVDGFSTMLKTQEARPADGNRPAASGDRLGTIEYFMATSTMTANKPYGDGPIVQLNWDGTNGFDSQIHVANGNGKRMQYRSQVSGEWNPWITLLDDNNYKSFCTLANLGAAQKPVKGGDSMSGYIRYPDTGIQIAWKRVTWTGPIASAWGGVFETASAISLGNWAAAFKDAPASFLGVDCATQNTDVWVSRYARSEKTTAGSAYLQRGSALSTSYQYIVYAFAVGTY